MKPIDFVKTYLPSARIAESQTGIDSVFSLAQAALESAWGDKAPLNNFFGIKDGDGIVNGNEQLLPTVEYSRYPHLTPTQVGLAEIDRIEWNETSYQFIYHGKGWFAKYDTPQEAFTKHAQLFFLHNKAGVQPYAKALPFVKDPERFCQEIAPIYASGPQYATLVISIMHSIKTLIGQYSL